MNGLALQTIETLLFILLLSVVVIHKLKESYAQYNLSVHPPRMTGVFGNLHEIWPQALGAMCSSLGYLTLGAVRVWSSPGLPSLFESGRIPGLDPYIDEPWIAATPELCAIAGALLVTWPLQKYGRKWTMVALAFPWILGFLLIGFAQNRAMIYAGRVCGGLMNGMIAPSAQVYISECSSPGVRGVMGSATAAGLGTGTLLCFVIGAYVPWDLLSLTLVVFPAIFGLSVACLPESPVWLLTQKKDTEAKKALQFYRGKCSNVEEEFQRMKYNVEQTMAVKKTGRIRDVFQGSAMKPLGIAMALMFFQQFGAIDVVLLYTVKIFKTAGSTVDKHTATIIIGVVLLACIIVSAYAVDIYGRRILLMVSGVLMALSMFAIGTFFYMKELWGDQQAEESLGWLPLAALLMFVVGFATGFSSVPFIVMGELFPVRYRHILSPISSSFNVFCTFIVVLSFPNVSGGLHLYGAFWFYACCSVLAVVFVYFFLPETKGKTLEEMEHLFEPDVPGLKELGNPSEERDSRQISVHDPEMASRRRISMSLRAAAATKTAALAAPKTLAV